jgi:hypothetical protein
MATVQWRPEVNALTTPQSYTVRYMPRATLGYDDLAAEMVRDNPLWDLETVKAMLAARDRIIMRQLINGNQVTLEHAFSYRLSFNARLNDPDDPLPPVEKMLKVKVSASRSFVKEVRQAAKLERLPAEEKLPQISTATDTVLGLGDVLNPEGAVQLAGANLTSPPEEGGFECSLEGTRSGRRVQSRLVSFSGTELTFLPDIPAQNDPWNNEYTLSIAARYTPHGTVRTGIYRRRLRSPLTVSGFSSQPLAAGILTGKAASPYVTITGGSLSADETVRVQVVFDLRDNSLLFSLLDMHENGRAGAAVKVVGNGPLTLPGFSGSALDNLNLTVNSFGPLTQLIRNSYSGRLVDMLHLRL